MTRATDNMRLEADRLCDEGDQLDQGEAWPLYARAGRLRDAAHLRDEADFDRKHGRVADSER